MNLKVVDFNFRKRSGDIREILSGGRIHDADLTYLELLGSGNCGTVHRSEFKYSLMYSVYQQYRFTYKPLTSLKLVLSPVSILLHFIE